MRRSYLRLGAFLISGVLATLVASADADEPDRGVADAPAERQDSDAQDRAVKSSSDLREPAVTATDSGKRVNELRYRLVRLERTHQKLLRNDTAAAETLDVVQHQLMQTERELNQVLRPDRRQENEPADDAGPSPRLRHLNIAAEHLTKAGFHGIAEQVRHHAKQIERGRDEPKRAQQPPAMMQSMQRSLDALLRELTTMRQQFDRMQVLR